MSKKNQPVYSGFVWKVDKFGGECVSFIFSLWFMIVSFSSKFISVECLYLRSFDVFLHWWLISLVVVSLFLLAFGICFLVLLCFYSKVVHTSNTLPKVKPAFFFISMHVLEFVTGQYAHMLTMRTFFWQSFFLSLQFVDIYLSKEFHGMWYIFFSY